MSWSFTAPSGGAAPATHTGPELKCDPRLAWFASQSLGIVFELVMSVDRPALARRDLVRRAMRLPPAGPGSADVARCGPAAAYTAGVRVSGVAPDIAVHYEVLLLLAAGAAAPAELTDSVQIGDVVVGVVSHADVFLLAGSADVLTIELAGAVLAQSPTAWSATSPGASVDHAPPPDESRRRAAPIGIVDMRFDLAHPDLAWRPGMVSGWPTYLPDRSGRRSKVRALFDLRASTAWGSGLIDLELEAWTDKASGVATLSPYVHVPHRPFATWSGAIDDHGTMAAYVAAGRPNTARWRRRRRPHPSVRGKPSGGVSPDSELLLVALDGELQTADIAHVPTVGDVVRGLRWMEGQLDADEPLVVNLSLATPFGPHDGTSNASLALDSFCEGPGRAIVVSAGNDNLLGRHVRTWDDEGEGSTVTWEVAATDDDDTPGAEVAGQRPTVCDGMQLWLAGQDLWNGGAVLRRAVLRIPDGKGSHAELIAEPGQRLWIKAKDDATGKQTRIWLDNRAAWDGNSCGRIEVWWEPEQDATIPLGDWQLQLQPLGGDDLPATIDAWLGINDATCIRWRQPVATVHSETVSDLATGRSVFAIGDAALTRRAPVQPPSPHLFPAGPTQPWLAVTSGCGPTRDGRNKPDFTAPGTLITVPCARDRSSTTQPPIEQIRFACGTSVSAPFVAGLCARLLGRDPGMDAQQLRDELVQQCATGATNHDAWGEGFLDR